jgi:hypothetical protein
VAEAGTTLSGCVCHPSEGGEFSADLFPRGALVERGGQAQHLVHQGAGFDYRIHAISPHNCAIFCHSPIAQMVKSLLEVYRRN